MFFSDTTGGIFFMATIRINKNKDYVVLNNTALNDEHLSRSEEHTSELQSRQYLVCRLLLEKKKKLLHVYIKRHKGDGHTFLHETSISFNLHWRTTSNRDQQT